MPALLSSVAKLSQLQELHLGQKERETIPHMSPQLYVKRPNELLQDRLALLTECSSLRHLFFHHIDLQPDQVPPPPLGTLDFELGLKE